MKDSSDIHGINELRKQRRKLELQMQVTQREFAHSVGMMNSNFRDVLLKRVVLPLGAVGLGYLVMKKWQRSRQKSRDKQQVNEIKKTVVASTVQARTRETPVKSPPITSNPVIEKQKVASTTSSIDFKKWLPVAIKLAKSGYEYYQNHLADQVTQQQRDVESEHQRTVARNFLQPKRQPQHGNPYDRIPEMAERD